MNVANAALLVIDMQRTLFEKSTPIYRADDLLDTILGLVDRAHEAGAPVVYIQHSSKMMERGTDAWRLHPRLQPADGDLLVEKTHGDAFEDTDLADVLTARSVATLIVTGLVTHGCVRATCLGGTSRGYDMILVADGHSNYNRKAARLVEEWNETLGSRITAVIPASDVHFGGAGAGRPS